MTLREYARTAAVFTFCLGLMCLPVGLGVNPKRDTSLFSNVADTGIWLRLGGGLIVVSAILFLLSYLLPDR